MRNRRAIAHTQQQSNLYLETSWCASKQVERMVAEVGPERVIFGSDAAVDGHRHFVQPHVEGHESYNEGLLGIHRALGSEMAEEVLAGNVRRLFRLPEASQDSEP
jgi:predicted TIM-barrel fold metal-dependent hydrolase